MITPDDKDWTWVLERPCPRVRLRRLGRHRPRGAGLIRANAARRGSAARRRAAITAGAPDPTRWSTLEYACHVRDVFRRFDERLELMLDEDDPLFANWDQDATAIEDRYGEQDPATVVADLAGRRRPDRRRLDGVDGRQWDAARPPVQRSVFTLDTLSRYLVHDPIHHVWDVRPGGAPA